MEGKYVHMNKTSYIIVGVVVVLLVFLGIKISSLSGVIEARDTQYRVTINALRDSISGLQRQMDTLKQQVPGLGEYMSTIQLHISKLWFAAQASNWELSSFELDELNETIAAGEALHVVRNKVDITGVLQSVQNTQLQLLYQSLQNKEKESFTKAYGQTLDACNGCHRSAGYGFIHVIIPTSQPVTNQRWMPGG